MKYYIITFNLFQTGIRGEDYDPFRVIRGKYFSLNEHSLDIDFFNHYKLILHLVLIASNNL